MAFGIVAVVVLIICIAGGGFLFSSGALDFLSQGNITNLPASTPTTQAVVEVPATGAPDTFAVLLSPEEAAKSYDSTLSVIQYALRVFGSFDPDKPTQMENPNLEPLKIRGEVCGTTQADLEKNVMLHEVYFELNGQRIPDSKVSTLDDSGFDSANNEVACRVYFVILGNWEKGSTYSIKEGENVVEAYKYGVDEMQAGAGSYEFIISIP